MGVQRVFSLVNTIRDSVAATDEIKTFDGSTALGVGHLSGTLACRAQGRAWQRV